MKIIIEANIWGLLALIIVCGCLIEIIKQIVSGVTTSRAMKDLMNIPSKERGKVINSIVNTTKDKK